MNPLRPRTAIRRRLPVIGALALAALLVAGLLVAGLISSARQARRERSAPAPEAAPVSPLLPPLSAPPRPVWTVSEEQRGVLIAPAGGDEATALYTVRAAPGSSRSGALAVFDAATGQRRSTVDLGGAADTVDCVVAGGRAACATTGPGGASLVFVELTGAAAPVRLPTSGPATGHRVGDGFLFAAPGSAPARYRPDGAVVWRAAGTSFIVPPGAPVLYARDKREGADGVGRVLAAADGRPLLEITVKAGQQVRFAAFGGGFALERPGAQIRFFAADGTPRPRAVSAQGGQRLAGAGDGPPPPVPVLLERRESGVSVVGVDAAGGRTLWRHALGQRDPDAVRVSGSGRRVIVDDGGGHCLAFDAGTGDGGAIACGRVLGTDGDVLALAPRGAGAATVEAVRPGDPAPLWRQDPGAPAAFGGGLYGRSGRLF